MEVFIFLSRPDTSNCRVDFSTDGSSRPDRIVTIRKDICSFPGSLTSGSRAYFLFKLHDPTSGESGRQQQLTTRLSSCILDMCAKWHYLARYFIGSRLVRLDDRFNFRSNLCPVSARPSRFYRKALDHFQQLYDKLGRLPEDLSCKKLYDLFFELPCVAPLCAGVWGAIVGRPINWWAAVWRKSRFKLIENRKNDLLWLLIHNAVRTRCNLKSWGYIDPDRCAVCSRTETNEHCFVDCPRVLEVWNYFTPVLARLSGSPFVPTFQTVMFPLANVPDSSLLLYHYFVATILFSVWQSRNLATFRNRVLSSRNIVDLVIRDIKTRILGEAVGRVKEIWALNNVICAVNSDESVLFHLR